MTNILPISRIPTIPKPAAVPSLWNHIYDEIDDRLKKLNDGKQEAGSGMDGFAPINSPAFTGSPTAPTPSTSDSDTSVATTAFVWAAIASNAAANSRPGHTYAENDWAWLDKPGGLIVQWATGGSIGDAERSTEIILPIAFPSACLFAQVATKGNGDRQDDAVFLLHRATLTSVFVFNQFMNSSNAPSIIPTIFAIGR